MRRVPFGFTAGLCILLGVLGSAPVADGSEGRDAAFASTAQEFAPRRLPNNLPLPNPGGFGASYSTEGFVDLTGAYFTPQGTNGRHCGTCHEPSDGWSLRPATIQRLFD